jgi:hypothetical protein
MGFPVGMQLATVAFGIPLTATGKDVVTKVSVKPTSTVIWAATGQPIPAFSDSFTAEGGQLGSFQVPFVDQAGFIDLAGNEVTDFAFQVNASWEFGNERPIAWAKNLKPLLGQTGTIDLDLVPDGPVSIPVTAPTAAVLGFEGRTGFITLQESDLPDRLSVEELSATILDQVETTVPPIVASEVTTEVAAAVPPAVTAALAADGTVAAAAAAAAGPAVSHELDSSPRIPKAGSANSFRIRDLVGRVALDVDSAGVVKVGPTQHKATPGWRVTDSAGKVALEVDENGRTHIYDPAFSTETPITAVHVISGIGQSNMSGFGRPVGTGYEYNAANPRVFQYGANTGVTTGITAETVPLDFNGAPNGLSPLTVIGREYLAKLPASHAVLLIPAAKGSTGLANTAASQGCWKIDYAGPNPMLWSMYLTQLDAALAAAAAKWPGATITHDATFWIQGEGDSSETRAAYESALDALIAAERTHVGDANHRFIIGGMVPDYMIDKPGNQAIRAAHVDTPRRVIRTTYADGIPNTANYGEEIHYAREGIVRLGKAMLASMDRATANLTSVSPIMPNNVTATAVGGTLTITWQPPASRVTAYVAEYKVDAGSWTTITGTEPLETSATVTGLSGTAVQVRVKTTNEVGTSTPSIPVTIGL